MGFGVGLGVGFGVGFTVGLTDGEGDGDGEGVGPIVITGIGVGLRSTPRLGLMIGPKVTPGPMVTGGPTDPIATVLGRGVGVPSGPAVGAGMSVCPMMSARTTPIRIVDESRHSWRRRSSSASRERLTV